MRWKFGVLIFIAVVAFLWLIKAPIMSAYISDKMGVPVNVSAISMWPTTTSIRNFRIANPSGFRSSSALKAKHIAIAYRFKNLTGNPTEIDLITLDNVTLNIEILNSSGSDNNWSAIGAGMPQIKSSREVIIHKLIINNLTVETEGPGADALGVAGTKYIDHLEYNEIDSREGFPTKELVKDIFQGAGLLRYLDKFLNPTDTIKKLNPLKLFGKSSE